MGYSKTTMRQILQNLKTGDVELADVPSSRAVDGRILIQTRASLISAGTERMLVKFGQANILSKARQRPEKVKMVLEKVEAEDFQIGDRGTSNGPYAELVQVPRNLCATAAETVSDDETAELTAR